MTIEKIRTLYAKINGIIDLLLTKIEKIYRDSEFAKNIFHHQHTNYQMKNLSSDT